MFFKKDIHVLDRLDEKGHHGVVLDANSVNYKYIIEYIMYRKEEPTSE